MYDIITNDRLKEFIINLNARQKIKTTLYNYIKEQISIGKHYSYNDFVREVKESTSLEKIFSPGDFCRLENSIDKFNKYLESL